MDRRVGIAAVALLLGSLTACDTDGESDTGSTADRTDVSDVSAIEQMSIAFNGSPSESEIQEAMDNALNATDEAITEDMYQRAGSVLVALRKKYGIDEMDILKCIPKKVTDARVPSLSFANVAAVCNVAFVQGEMN